LIDYTTTATYLGDFLTIARNTPPALFFLSSSPAIFIPPT
jgi:hypothetical protein